MVRTCIGHARKSKLKETKKNLESSRIMHIEIVVILSKLNNSHVWNWNCQSTTKMRIIVNNPRYSRYFSPSWKLETLFAVLCLLWVAEFHSIAWQDCSNFKLHFHILCDSGFWMLNSIFIVMVTQQPKPLICFPESLLWWGKNTRDTRWEHDLT